MVRDNRHVFTYIFGAICPDRAVGAAMIMPYANTEAMNEHLKEISAEVAPGAHAVLVCDGAGWHQRGKKLAGPSSLSELEPNGRRSVCDRSRMQGQVGGYCADRISLVQKADAMSMSFKPLLLVAALGLATSAYAAEQPAPPHDHSPAPDPAAAPAAPAAKGGMMGMDGMSGGIMDMGPMHCMGLSEQRLSGLKTELSITDRQLRAWNAFAATMKTEAHPMPVGMTMPVPMKPGAMPGMMGGDGMMAMMMSKPLPERLAHHEMMMKEHLKALHKVRTAVTGLYGVLTPEQRVVADKSLCGGMAR